MKQLRGAPWLLPGQCGGSARWSCLLLLRAQVPSQINTSDRAPCPAGKELQGAGRLRGDGLCTSSYKSPGAVSSTSGTKKVSFQRATPHKKCEGERRADESHGAQLCSSAPKLAPSPGPPQSQINMEDPQGGPVLSRTVLAWKTGSAGGWGRTPTLFHVAKHPGGQEGLRAQGSACCVPAAGRWRGWVRVDGLRVSAGAVLLGVLRTCLASACRCGK